MIEWSQVGYTATLGAKPQEFIFLLATYCQTVDVQQAIEDITTVHLPSANTGMLALLTTEHGLQAQNNNMTKFWQSVIEVQITLQCERFVWHTTQGLSCLCI